MDPVGEGKVSVPECEPLLLGEALELLIVAVDVRLEVMFADPPGLDCVVEMTLDEATVEFTGVGKNCVGSGKSVAGFVESEVALLDSTSEEDVLTKVDSNDVTVPFNVTVSERKLVVPATTLLLLKENEVMRTADDEPLNLLLKLKVERVWLFEDKPPVTSPRLDEVVSVAVP